MIQIVKYIFPHHDVGLKTLMNACALLKDYWHTHALVFEVSRYSCVLVYQLGAIHHSFSYYCSGLWCVQIMKYHMARLSYSLVTHITLPHYRHYGEVSEGVRFLNFWSSKFSQFSFMQYTRLCVFDLHLFRMMFVRISVLYFNDICHSWGLGHETKIWAICLSIFL